MIFEQKSFETGYPFAHYIQMYDNEVFGFYLILLVKLYYLEARRRKNLNLTYQGKKLS